MHGAAAKRIPPRGPRARFQALLPVGTVSKALRGGLQICSGPHRQPESPEPQGAEDGPGSPYLKSAASSDLFAEINPRDVLGHRSKEAAADIRTASLSSATTPPSASTQGIRAPIRFQSIEEAVDRRERRVRGGGHRGRAQPLGGADLSTARRGEIDRRAGDIAVVLCAIFRTLGRSMESPRPCSCETIHPSFAPRSSLANGSL